MARYVAQQIARPTLLEIATKITDKPSPGSVKTLLDILPDGTLARREGQLVRTSIRQGMRHIQFIDRERIVLPLSLGDLATAYKTTGIPNITTYMAFPKENAKSFLRAEPIFRNLLAIAPLRRPAQKLIEKSVQGPDEHTRQTERSYVWVYARNEAGIEKKAWLETPESYHFTAVAGVRCVEKALAKRPQGALPPALAFGADFVLEIPGTRRVDRLVVAKK